MELAFRKHFESECGDLSILAKLDPIQQSQLVIVARAFQGHEIDFEDGYLERFHTEFDQLFEFGFKFLHVFHSHDLSTPVFDVWSDNIDFVQIFEHGTTTDAGAGRTQGPFDPTDPNNKNHVELAEALQTAYFKVPREHRP